MGRFLFLMALNLALPFLVHRAWRLVRHIWLKKTGKPMPPRHTPVVKLLVVGMVLLVITLFGLRILHTERDTAWQPANPAVSREGSWGQR